MFIFNLLNQSFRKIIQSSSLVVSDLPKPKVPGSSPAGKYVSSLLESPT